MVCVEDDVAVETSERIGRFDFSVREGADSPDFAQRYAGRADALAAWLLARWREQNPENN
jgi:hypothetical protein